MYVKASNQSQQGKANQEEDMVSTSATSYKVALKEGHQQ